MLNNFGFTMAELVIVISIIAILASAEFFVYYGGQITGRDVKRVSDINSIAKTIETLRDPLNGTYGSTYAQFRTDFPSNPPDDPVSNRHYCIAINNTEPISPIPPPTSNTLAANGCPTPLGSYQPLGMSFPIPSNTKAWTLCASMENRDKPNCIQSLQR
jgi:prepilin-type N-terminal cleavage/methylation domain-containing protein